MNLCILIRVKPGKMRSVLARVREFKGVKHIIPTFGRYDVVVFATAKDYDEAKSLSREINAIRDVKSTETLVSASA